MAEAGYYIRAYCCQELNDHVTVQQQHIHGLHDTLTQLSLPLEVLQLDLCMSLQVSNGQCNASFMLSATTDAPNGYCMIR